MQLDPKALEAAIDHVRARNLFTLDGAIAEGVSKYLSASIPAGLDAVDMDMIQRGDMLGPELGARVASALLSLSARIEEMKMALDWLHTESGGMAIPNSSLDAARDHALALLNRRVA